MNLLPPPPHVDELQLGSTSVPQHLLLRMPLTARRAGNIALLKLISCENKMEEFEDDAEQPNIDIQYVALRGVSAALSGAAVAAGAVLA